MTGLIQRSNLKVVDHHIIKKSHIKIKKKYVLDSQFSELSPNNYGFKI